MAIHTFEETEVRPFADPEEFGGTCGYDMVRARADVRLDPASPANAAITDIARARRGADGRPHIVADVLMLRPRAPATGNGGLLVVVPNRGTTGGLPFSLGRRNMGGIGGALALDDGWILRQGWTVAWVGWQWDIAAGGALLGCDAPDVLGDDGRPLRGVVRIQLQPNAPSRSMRLNTAGDLRGSASRFYRAADLDDASAILRIGRGRAEPDRIVPRAAWRFAVESGDGAVMPDAEHIWLDGGFVPGFGYEVCYTTDVCPLVGSGLAAVRDVAAHLRHDAMERRLRYTVAVGWSQSGRFLRQLLRDGLTHDERGRAVFDGVIPFIAGASGGEFNQRYGQPAEALAPGLGHLPPFDGDGLLTQGHRTGRAPKVMLVNTASEYWRGDGSLGHIDPAGTSDLPAVSGIRHYALAGAEHVGGAEIPLLADRRNWIALTPIYRALLEAMRRWIVDGAAPPANRLPRLDDGSAVPRTHVLARFDSLGFGSVPGPNRLASRRAVDAGPLAASGVAAYPVKLGPAYPAFVSNVDADGNEIAGVRPVEVAVPLATHTGWNALLAQGPQWDDLGVLAGNSYPFARTAQARAASGDPRLSIAERYPSRADYERLARMAAHRLCAEGFLLAGDIGSVTDDAVRRYDALMASPDTLPSSNP